MMKSIIKKIDVLIGQIKNINELCDFKNCRFLSIPGTDFVVIIAGNGKKYVAGNNKYDRHISFTGCILSKYNNSVYDLVKYMVLLDQITEEQCASFTEYALKKRNDAYLANQIKEANRLLQNNGYTVKKVKA